jgi:hypothetical protein
MIQLPPIFTNSSFSNLSEKQKLNSTVEPTNKAEKSKIVQRSKDTEDERQKRNSNTPPVSKKNDDADDEEHSFNISI